MEQNDVRAKAPSILYGRFIWFHIPCFLPWCEPPIGAGCLPFTRSNSFCAIWVCTSSSSSMTDDWMGFCTMKTLFGSNRKASSQMNSSRSFRPLRPRSKTSTAASIGQIPVRPLVVSVCCLLWCFRPFGLFSRILPCWFLRRVLEGSPSLLVVLIPKCYQSDVSPVRLKVRSSPFSQLLLRISTVAKRKSQHFLGT